VPAYLGAALNQQLLQIGLGEGGRIDIDRLAGKDLLSVLATRFGPLNSAVDDHWIGMKIIRTKIK
jgi:hypothetical protein